MVERGVEISVASAGDEFGERRGAGPGIGESFPERVIIGGKRSACEKQADEGSSHVWNMSVSDRLGKAYLSAMALAISELFRWNERPNGSS
jgi:hypothetical protein